MTEEPVSHANGAAAPQPVGISIDVVSDVVCPWCYLGKRNLEHALAAIEADGGIAVHVRWRPFQLDPTIPKEGHDRKAYMRAKFGDSGRLEEAHRRLSEAGARAGIAFDFEAITRSPNTLDAHRLIRWAAAEGEDVQARLVDLLFRFYFERGRDIGDRAVLIEAAREAGLDAAVVSALLDGDADRAEVVKEIETAQRMGVTGVPCYILDGRYAVMGAQPPETLAGALREIARDKASGTNPNGSAR